MSIQLPSTEKAEQKEEISVGVLGVKNRVEKSGFLYESKLLGGGGLKMIELSEGCYDRTASGSYSNLSKVELAELYSYLITNEEHRQKYKWLLKFPLLEDQLNHIGEMVILTQRAKEYLGSGSCLICSTPLDISLVGGVNKVSSNFGDVYIQKMAEKINQSLEDVMSKVHYTLDEMISKAGNTLKGQISEEQRTLEESIVQNSELLKRVLMSVNTQIIIPRKGGDEYNIDFLLDISSIDKASDTYSKTIGELKLLIHSLTLHIVNQVNNNLKKEDNKIPIAPSHIDAEGESLVSLLVNSRPVTPKLKHELSIDSQFETKIASSTVSDSISEFLTSMSNKENRRSILDYLAGEEREVVLQLINDPHVAFINETTIEEAIDFTLSYYLITRGRVVSVRCCLEKILNISLSEYAFDSIEEYKVYLLKEIEDSNEILPTILGVSDTYINNIVSSIYPQYSEFIFDNKEPTSDRGLRLRETQNPSQLLDGITQSPDSQSPDNLTRETQNPSQLLDEIFKVDTQTYFRIIEQRNSLSSQEFGRYVTNVALTMYDNVTRRLSPPSSLIEKLKNSPELCSRSWVLKARVKIANSESQERGDEQIFEMSRWLHSQIDSLLDGSDNDIKIPDRTIIYQLITIGRKGADMYLFVQKENEKKLKSLYSQDFVDTLLWNLDRVIARSTETKFLYNHSILRMYNSRFPTNNQPIFTDKGLNQLEESSISQENHIQSSAQPESDTGTGSYICNEASMRIPIVFVDLLNSKDPEEEIETKLTEHWVQYFTDGFARSPVPLKFDRRSDTLPRQNADMIDELVATILEVSQMLVQALNNKQLIDPVFRIETNDLGYLKNEMKSFFLSTRTSKYVSLLFKMFDSIENVLTLQTSTLQSIVTRRTEETLGKVRSREELEKLIFFSDDKDFYESDLLLTKGEIESVIEIITALKKKIDEYKVIIADFAEIFKNYEELKFDLQTQL